MLKIRNSFIVGILFVISFFVLSYKLSSVPPGVYVDEAVTGINAYSILKTGKDEYGKSFPAAFRFFGSYSPPLYTYLTTIPTLFLGLNEISVRIISVICGSLMLIVLYWYLKKSGLVDKEIIPSILLLFIITPWNFFFGRTGYELYLGFFLFSLGSLFLWLGINTEKFVTLGIAVLSLSTYGSFPQIYSVPIFLLFFMIFFLKSLDKKYLLAGIISGLVIQIPHIMLLGTNVLLTKGDLFYLSEIYENAGKIPFPFLISFLLSLIYSLLARITIYFSPNSLFFFPDPDPQRSMPELSVFYNWMIVPYLTGLYVLIVNFKDKFVKFLIILTLATVIPPALTHDTFSTQRALPLLLPLFLIIGIGISVIYKKIGQKKFLFVHFSIFIVSAILLWRSYFVLLPSERAITWGYGYKDLAKYISQNQDKNFVIENTLGKPVYAQLAFYLKIDPSILQNSVNSAIMADYYNLNKFNADTSFGNIEVRAIVWEKDIYRNQILVGSELAISKNQAKEHFLEEILRISDTRGYPILIGYQTNPQEKCLQTNQFSVLCPKIDLETFK